MTTILVVRKNKQVVICGDGQVSIGSTVFKNTASKIKVFNNTVMAGIAGSAADGMALFGRLEQKLNSYSGQLLRSCAEMAKDWRMDKYLRKLDAMMIVADKEATFLLSGTGDMLSGDDDVLAIGSGGSFARSAALAMMDSDYDAEYIARKAMKIAADICIYTNDRFMIKKIDYSTGIEKLQVIDIQTPSEVIM